MDAKNILRTPIGRFCRTRLRYIPTPISIMIWISSAAGFTSPQRWKAPAEALSSIGKAIPSSWPTTACHPTSPMPAPTVKATLPVLWWISLSSLTFATMPTTTSWTGNSSSESLTWFPTSPPTARWFIHWFSTTPLSTEANWSFPTSFSTLSHWASTNYRQFVDTCWESGDGFSCPVVGLEVLLQRNRNYYWILVHQTIRGGVYR